MSVSSLFCPNNNTIYAKEFKSDDPNNIGNVPAMSVKSIAQQVLTLGTVGSTIIVTASCRGVNMLLNGFGQGLFATNTIDFISTIAQDPDNPAIQLVQVTVHIPQFSITAQSGSATSIITIGTTTSPIIPINLRPIDQREIQGCEIIQVATGIFAPVSIQINSTGTIVLNYLAGSYANAINTLAELCFTYTLALS